MNELLDKEGNPIKYTNKDYDLESQTNEISGNMYNPNARYKSQTVYDANLTTGETIHGGDFIEKRDRRAYAEDYEDIIQNRIDTQSKAAKAGLAVGMGLVGAVGTALKDIGYLSSPETFANFVGYHDVDNYNLLSRALIASGDWLEQGSDKWAPIYEEQADTVADQVFRWGTLKGVVQSSVGFLIPGMAVGKAVTGVSAGIIKGGGKLAKYMEGLETLNTAQKAVLKSGRALESLATVEKAFPTLSAASKTLGATYIQGTGEAVWEAVDAHDQVLKDLSFGINAGRVSPIEALQMAELTGHTTFLGNIAMVGLDYQIMKQFMPKVGGKQLDDPFKELFKNAVTEIPKESIQEGGQNMLRKEAEYQAAQKMAESGTSEGTMNELRKLGKYGNVNTPTEFVDRMITYAKSNDVIVDAIIGGISGPVQSRLAGMMGGDIVPGRRYKKDKAAYKQQQKEIKAQKDLIMDDIAMDKKVQEAKANAQTQGNMGANLQPVKVQNNLNKAKAAKDLYDVSVDDEVLNEIAKEQVFTSIINESIAKGTFEALLKDAAALKGTNAFSNSLYDYARKVEKKYTSLGNIYNKASIINKMNLVDSMEKTLLDFKAKKITLDAIENPSNLEIERSADYAKSISTLEESILDSKNIINEQKSFKYQLKLNKKLRAIESVDRLTQELATVSNTARLNTIADLYPEITRTKEYADAKARLKSKVNPTVVTPRPETIDVQEKVNPNPNEPKQPPKVEVTPKKSAIPTYDDSTIDSKIEEAITKYGVEFNESEKLSMREAARKVSDNIANDPTNYSRYGGLMDSTILSYVANAAAAKEKENKGNKDAQDEINAEVRASILGVPISNTPEATLTKVLSLILEQRQLYEQSNAIEKDTEIPEEDKKAKILDLRKKVTEIGTKLLPSAKRAFTRAATLEAKFNAAEGNPESNTGAKSWDEVKSDFDSYIKYIEDIMGEDFVKANFDEIKALFRGEVKNKNKEVADNYAAHKAPLVYNTDTADNSLSDKSAKEYAELLENRRNRIESEDRLMYNKNHVDSISHLSESNQRGVDDKGNTLIFRDSHPKRDISPIVEPDKYNSGEDITFELDLEYKGTVTVEDAFGNRSSMLWPELMGILFSELPSKGKPGKFNPYAIETLEKTKGLVIQTVYDVIPIAIKGKDGEHLGYTHDTTFINSSSVAEEDVERLRMDLINKKKSIIDNLIQGLPSTGKIRGKIIKATGISGFYKGFVMSFSATWLPADSSIPDDFTVGVVTNSGISIDGSSINQSQILNYNTIKDNTVGLPVILIPVGKVGRVMQYHAEVLYTTELSSSHKELAMSIVKTFLSKDTESQAYKFYKKFGIDITTAYGASLVCGSFMNVYNDGKGTKTQKLDFESYLKNEGGNTGVINFKETEEGQVVTFGTRVPFKITGSDVRAMGAEKAVSKLGVFFKEGYFRYSANKTILSNERKGDKVPPIATVDKNGSIVLANSTYAHESKKNSRTRIIAIPTKNGGNVYTLQNIVEFDVTNHVPALDESIKAEAIPNKTEEKKKEDNKTLVTPVTEFITALGENPKAKDIGRKLGLSPADAKDLEYLLANKGSSKSIEDIVQRSPDFKAKYPITLAPEYAILSVVFKEMIYDLYENSYIFTLNTSSDMFKSAEGAQDVYSRSIRIASENMEISNEKEFSRPCKS